MPLAIALPDTLLLASQDAPDRPGGYKTTLDLRRELGEISPIGPLAPPRRVG